MAINRDPRYSVGKIFGRLTITKAGPFQRENPGQPEKQLKRPAFWFEVQCDCGAPRYWVYKDKFRKHTKCDACTKKAKARKSKPTPSQTVRPGAGVPDFLRMRLVGFS